MSSAIRPTVSILVIGDEIVAGHVSDQNGTWLANRVHSHGLSVRRIVALSDRLDEIVEELQRELAARRPRLVLTTGGVGPTPDDRTYQAVAAALGLRLTTSQQILAWAEEWMEGMDPNHARGLMSTMAAVPQGAELLAPEVTGGPAVAVHVDGGIKTQGGATIVMLPGVPAYAQSLMINGVEPALLGSFRAELAVVEIEHEHHEALLGPCFDLLAEGYPRVSIGSYVGDPNLIRLEGPPLETEEAARALRSRLRSL